MHNRRNFLKHTLAAAGTTLLGTQMLQAAGDKGSINQIKLQANDIILFQGDSITDHGRDRNKLEANEVEGLGKGYTAHTARTLLHLHADKQLKIYNRGIGGHKVPQLQARWQQDCLDLKPNILSILIGVNDYWHKRDGHYSGSSSDFKSQYRQLLDTTLKHLPDIKLIIGEPFGVKGVKYVNESWFPEFAEYQNATKDIAEEYNALFIPYQDIFDKACKTASGEYWAYDGIHTSPAGISLMAETVLKCFK